METTRHPCYLSFVVIKDSRCYVNGEGIIMMDTASRTAPPLVRVTTDFTTNRACSRQGIHNNSCCPGGQHWLGLGFEVLLLCGYAPVKIIKYETALPSRRRRKGGSA
jgi:hypothetical protein